MADFLQKISGSQNGINPLMGMPRVGRTPLDGDTEPVRSSHEGTTFDANPTYGIARPDMKAKYTGDPVKESILHHEPGAACR